MQWVVGLCTSVRSNFILGYPFKVFVDVRCNLDVVEHLMKMTSLKMIYYLQKYVDVEVDAWESSHRETIKCNWRVVEIAI